MRKARKIKIRGVELKYFLDTGATDEDGCSYRKVILYHDDGTTSWWNSPPTSIDNRIVKQAVLDGQFFNHRGPFVLDKAES